MFPNSSRGSITPNQMSQNLFANGGPQSFLSKKGFNRKQTILSPKKIQANSCLGGLMGTMVSDPFPYQYRISIDVWTPLTTGENHWVGTCSDKRRVPAPYSRQRWNSAAFVKRVYLCAGESFSFVVYASCEENDCVLSGSGSPGGWTLARKGLFW